MAQSFPQTLEAAVYAAEEMEATAKLARLTRSLEPNILSNEQVQEIVKQYNVGGTDADILSQPRISWKYN